MRHLLLCLLLLGLPAVAHAQERPEKPPEPAAAPGPVQGALDTGGHTTPVLGLAFTPDGKKLISLGHREVFVWDTASAARERTWRLPTALETLAVSPDGTTVAVAATLQWDGKERFAPVWLLDLATGGARLIRPPIAYNVGSLAFSPDGRRLAWSTWYQAGVWGLKAGRATHLLIRGDSPGRVAFAGDGNRLLDVWPVYDKARAQVWDVTPRPGKRPLELKEPLFEVKGAGLLLASAPDGSRFADWDKSKGVQVRLWTADGKREKADGEAGQRTIALRGSPEPDLLQFLTPERLAVAAAGKERVRVSFVNVPAGTVERVRNCPLPPQEKRQLAVSPDGKFLAATSGPGYQVVLFDLEGDPTAHHLGAAYRVPTRVGWSPDSRAIGWGFGSDAGLARGLNLATLEPLGGKQLQGFKGSRGARGWSLHFEEKDRRESKTRGLTLVHGGKRVETTLDSPPGPHTFYEGADGKLGLAVVNHWGNGDLSLVDTETGKVTRVAHDTYGTHVAVSPDGRFLLLARENQALDVYHIEGKPALLLKVLAAGPDWIAWAPKGYYAATPAAERMMGWTGKKDDHTPLTFYPAERFRRRLYRPDVIKLLLEKGHLEDALGAANAARKNEGEKVAEGVADLEQLLPPRATLVVADRTKLPRVKVKATAAAAVPKEQVLGLRLLVDGRPLPDGQGVLDLKAAQEKAEAEWEVELPPGAHELKVLARGLDTSGVSAAVAVDVPAAERPTLHLIAVGIDNYPQKALHLDCAVRDARGLVDAFPKHCTGTGNLFGAARPRPLLNGDATRAAVLGALKEARKGVKPGDLLVFSFAGHGARQGKKFYLLTIDADPEKLADTALSGDDLRAVLADMPCQVLLLLDACHSAAGVRAFIDEAARGLTDDETGVAVLCAAMGHEEAIEQDGHGLFSKAVVEGLARSDRVPYNYHDRRQYVDHLGTFVRDEVQAASHDQQHPFLSLPYVTEAFPIRRLPERPSGGR